MADIVRRNIVKRPVTLRVKGLALITVTQGRTCTEKLLNHYVLIDTFVEGAKIVSRITISFFSRE